MRGQISLKSVFVAMRARQDVEEAGPAGPAVELLPSVEQRQVAGGAEEKCQALLAVERALPGRSVSSSNSTWYCSRLRSFFHSSLDFINLLTLGLDSAEAACTETIPNPNVAPTPARVRRKFRLFMLRLR